MCFHNKKNWKIAKVAAEDIIVYKGLDRDSRNKEILKSPYNPTTKWKSNVICKIKSGFVRVGNPSTIHIGFHSCKNQLDASFHSKHVFKFKIPAGSLYWENNEEYVSDTIILLKKTPEKKLS